MNFLSKTKAGDLKFALRTITIVSILMITNKLGGIITPPASIILALLTMTILAGWRFWWSPRQLPCELISAAHIIKFCFIKLIVLNNLNLGIIERKYVSWIKLNIAIIR